MYLKASDIPYSSLSVTEAEPGTRPKTDLSALKRRTPALIQVCRLAREHGLSVAVEYISFEEDDDWCILGKDYDYDLLDIVDDSDF